MSSAMSSSEPPRDQTQDEDYTLEDEYSALFDLSPQRFPWHEPVPQRVRQQRDIYDGTLFLDTMLEAAQVENARALYPPWDPESFGDLYNAVRKAKWDRMRKDCIVYYLLKWWEDGREVKFRRQRSIPPQFSTLADAYYFFDMGEATKAANLVIDARIPPNHSSKILRILSNSQDGGPTILRYVRSAHPVLTEQSSLDIYALALAESSLQDAWLFQRTFPQETPSRKQLIEKIVLSCLAPPKPSHLRQLLAFPTSPWEHSVLRDLALNPPPILSPSSQSILQDLLLTRLVHLGQYVNAAKLNDQFPPSQNPESKSAAAARREMIEEIMNSLPPIQRKMIDKELSGFTNSAPLSTSDSWISVDNPEVTMSWEDLSSSRRTQQSDGPKIARATPGGTATPLKPNMGTPVKPASINLGSAPQFSSFRTPSPATMDTPPQYLRANGAPSPGSTWSSTSRKPIQNPILRSVQKTGNAFFQPPPPPSAPASNFSFTPSRRFSGNASLNSRFISSPLRKSTSGTQVDVDMTLRSDIDEDDDIVLSNPPRFIPENTSIPAPSQSAPETTFRLREEPPIASSSARPLNRQATETMLPPGAFPSSEQGLRSEPTVLDEPMPSLPKLSTQSDRTKRRRPSPTLPSPEIGSVPGGFDEPPATSESRDDVPSLPSASTSRTTRGNRKRTSRTSSVVSEDEPPAVRRSSRLSAAPPSPKLTAKKPARSSTGGSTSAKNMRR